MCNCIIDTNAGKADKYPKSMAGTIVSALCACVLLISLLTSAFVPAHDDHEHDQEGPNGNCAICFHMTSAKNLYKQLSAAVISLHFLWKSVFVSYSLVTIILLIIDSFTPVDLKVRMNH